MSHRLTVNGRAVEIDVPGGTPLADVLRDHLHLRGTKVSCGTGRCGSCTVRLGDRAVASCLLPVALAETAPVTTVEGLSAPDGPLHPVQEAMVSCHGVQCGACTPGMVMTLSTFLDTTADPDAGQVREELTGNLCRCTGYHTIVDAALTAAAAAPTPREDRP
ncbi:(2Fe-2S)-binding protein [Pseudonocardia sp. KRD-184]|uniref:(2Fe-2S)-binding protein n=1 Tax=Pseudonocardia oceani TaxID=2792013 RepID=A0ABS6UAL6_9PSEU|nr:(2Fe-2S)-binding protein [Pseudonocardia oceani]MBW0088927.1 (2Fe-2S)-binding protein [Pseudonocardia oceani]MBW0096086.1 (2Fe-2S)-binding protein [Pseudonocardia oceani]MBW0108876.1 (2Fe-2S)-binding protein [Pseudonocardia oceani]MBW0122682.1 (2Fe-2S)-binding protein [Pseudonocardia oceani]MBW0129282.1 (2Fe-2S)-binding protein [Pseudonocardia oceani]